MKTSHAELTSEDAIADDDRWALVTRIAASKGLSRATQLRELLLYTAKKAITAPGEEVTEQEIGWRVLGRRPDYNPQDDNIVRVQIRHLRQRLEEYYANEGSSETILVTIPKGGRIPRFEPIRTNQSAELPNEAPARRVDTRWLWLALAALALVVAAVFLGRLSAGWTRPSVTERSDLHTNPLFARLFPKDQETTIVIADSSLVILQDVLHTSISLNQYIDGSYRNVLETVNDASLRSALTQITQRQYTSLADATVSGKMYAIGKELGAPVTVRYARHMNIRDFTKGNFVMVGSRRANPWLEQFEPDLNFHFGQVGQNFTFGFQNRKPADGEAREYLAALPGNGPFESFATVALLPNTSGKGCVLLFNGANMESTEAAGEFAVSPDFPDLVRRTMGLSAGQDLPFFEILLKINVMAGAPRQVHVIAWRKPHR